MQGIWAWYRQSPSLVRLDVCLQELGDMHVSAGDVESFGRAALGVLRNG